LSLSRGNEHANPAKKRFRGGRGWGLISGFEIKTKKEKVSSAEEKIFKKEEKLGVSVLGARRSEIREGEIKCKLF